MALDFGNKVSNNGINAYGKLTADEFNQLVAQINSNERRILNLDAAKYGCLRINQSGYLQGFATDSDAALYDADPILNAALLRLNVLIPTGTGGGSQDKKVFLETKDWELLTENETDFSGLEDDTMYYIYEEEDTPVTPPSTSGSDVSISDGAEYSTMEISDPSAVSGDTVELQGTVNGDELVISKSGASSQTVTVSVSGDVMSVDSGSTVIVEGETASLQGSVSGDTITI